MIKLIPYVGVGNYIRIVVVRFYHTTVGTGSLLIPNLTLKAKTSNRLKNANCV